MFIKEMAKSSIWSDFENLKIWHGGEELFAICFSRTLNQDPDTDLLGAPNGLCQYLLPFIYLKISISHLVEYILYTIKIHTCVGLLVYHLKFTGIKIYENMSMAKK